MTTTLKIGQVAELLRTAVSWLRKIEREGLIAPPQRDSLGERLYTTKDIAAIKRVLDAERSEAGRAALKRLLDAESEVAVERAANLGDTKAMPVSADGEDSRRGPDPDLVHLAEDLVAPFTHGLTDDGRRGLTRGIARLLDRIALLEAELEYVAATRLGRVRRPGSSRKSEAASLLPVAVGRASA